MPSVIVYTEDGRESINSNKKPLLASVKKLVTPSGGVVNNQFFPLTSANTFTNPNYPSRITKNPYANRAEEGKGLVFIKPSHVNNGVRCFGYYSNTDVDTFYSVFDLSSNGNYNMDVMMADIDVVPRDRGYINMYADDAANTLMWSIETLRCGINVVSVLPFSQQLLTVLIPTWVDKSKLYVSVPHSIIYNRDNGTDAVWDVSEVGFQIIGNTAYIRCRRVTEAGHNRTPPPGGFIVLAEITNALNYQTI